MFHHPPIRTVAYESQLKSDRADRHHRVLLEAGDPTFAVVRYDWRTRAERLARWLKTALLWRDQSLSVPTPTPTLASATTPAAVPKPP